eukprot:3173171-Pyramimonas_sp.AAC.1
MFPTFAAARRGHLAGAAAYFLAPDPSAPRRMAMRRFPEFIAGAAMIRLGVWPKSDAPQPGPLGPRRSSRVPPLLGNY